MNNKKKIGFMAIVFSLLVAMMLMTACTPQGQLSVTQQQEQAKLTATGDCNTAPTVNLAVRDANNKGTAVTPATTAYRVNGIYFASAPTFKFGDKVQVLVGNSSWIDVVTGETTLVCGANTIAQDLSAYTAPTVEIKEDSVVLTDNAAGGASNGSDVTAGGSQTFRVFLTGTDKKTTGNMVYVVELSDNNNVSSVTMYNAATGASLEEVTVPSFYSNTLSSPYKKAFKIPAVVGAKEMEYKMTIVAKSGKTIAGAVYTTFYSAQAFVDTDATFVSEGVEDKDGTTKYEATFDYDVFLS